jgi:hypothetical protein
MAPEKFGAFSWRDQMKIASVVRGRSTRRTSVGVCGRNRGLDRLRIKACLAKSGGLSSGQLRAVWDFSVSCLPDQHSIERGIALHRPRQGVPCKRPISLPPSWHGVPCWLARRRRSINPEKYDFARDRAAGLDCDASAHQASRASCRA